LSYFQLGVSPNKSLRNASREGFASSEQTKVATSHGFSVKASDEERKPKVRGIQALGSGSGFSTERFSAPNEPLDRDTILDDITPKSDAAAINMFARIYREDAVAGAATDLISSLPWSDYTLSGIDDPAMMRIYEEAMERFNPEVTMPTIACDYLKYGRVILSLLFDEQQQTWGGFIPVDLTFADITPIPLFGHDPKIDMRLSPEMAAFLKSKDPRDKHALSMLPAKMRKRLGGDKVPLDTLTTLFLSRRVSLTDWKGTSLYHRILPYYAIERALMTSTISNARRRTRSILHLTVGIDEKWEPTPEQLNEVIEAFQTTEEDPVGAVIATRSGIEANEIRSGADFWKISEEADFLKSSKLAALGLSDSFLSGEASYSTVDAAMSVFVENLKVFRSTLTQRTFYDKYFEHLARAHNFVKRKQADLAHGVRTEIRSNPSVDDALSIPKRDLLIPSIHWTKNLSPESDANYMDILEKAQSHGIPVTLKQWASAAGIDINALEQMLPENEELKKRLKKFLPKPAPGEGGGEDGGGDFGAFSHVDMRGSIALGSIVGDAENKEVLGVTHKDFAKVVALLTRDNRTQRILRDDIALSRWLNERYEGDANRVDGMRYLLTRAGFADCRISTAFIGKLASELQTKARESLHDRERLKMIQHEVSILAAIYNFKSDRDTLKNSDRAKARNNVLDSSVRDVLTKNRQNVPKSRLYAGV
jgi:hypothetical protein